MLHKRLEAAHRETNLYLDIMTHDIKNAENVASLYCDLLIDILEGDAAGYARSLRESIRKSTSILQNVATIRRILQELPDLKPVRLGHVVRAELDRIPEVDISFEDSPVEVWADDLLPEIFRNLIGNAARFGGPDVRIAIRVEDRPGDEDAVMVAVEDTGPGIPDEIKETIFHRFQRGGTQGYGEGLGLPSPACWSSATAARSGSDRSRGGRTSGRRFGSHCGGWQPASAMDDAPRTTGSGSRWSLSLAAVSPHARSAAITPERNIPSNVPAPPMLAIGAPSSAIRPRLRRSAPIRVPSVPLT